jgi:hypothetical protein
MITDVPGVSDIVSRINEELPPEIRLWGFVCNLDRTLRLLAYPLFLLAGANAKFLQRAIVRASH